MPSDKPMTPKKQNKNNIHDEKDKNIHHHDTLVTVPDHHGAEQDTHQRQPKSSRLGHFRFASL